MKIVYTGTDPDGLDIALPEGGAVHAAPDEPVEVPDPVGKSLVSREDFVHAQGRSKDKD